MGKTRIDRRRGRAVARAFACVATIALAALIATGCGGTASGSSVPLIGVTTGRDPTGVFPKVIAECNAKAKGRWKIQPIMAPPTVDAQREQIIRRFAGKDPSLDVVSMDVIWTAEFSEAGWILDLTKRMEPIKSQFVPAPLSTAYYHNKYWGFPVGTNVALIFYRTDLVPTAPKTWEEVVAISKKVQATHPGMSGLLWQANQYEGLTVDALEFLLAAKAQVLDPTGKKSLLAQGDGALKAFTFMRMLVADGITPKTVTTFQEEESRQVFQQGTSVFLRNWPYVYQLANGPESKIKGKFAAAPLPSFKGGASAGVLGGVNYGISRFSRHPELAFEAIQCIASPENQKRQLIAKGQMPTLEETYHDPEVKAKVPYIDIVRAGLDNAYSRPVTPYYNDLTVALYTAAHEVIAGSISPEEAVKKANRGIQLAIEGNGEI